MAAGTQESAPKSRSGNRRLAMLFFGAVLALYVVVGWAVFRLISLVF